MPGNDARSPFKRCLRRRLSPALCHLSPIFDALVNLIDFGFTLVMTVRPDILLHSCNDSPARHSACRTWSSRRSGYVQSENQERKTWRRRHSGPHATNVSRMALSWHFVGCPLKGNRQRRMVSPTQLPHPVAQYCNRKTASLRPLMIQEFNAMTP